MDYRVLPDDDGVIKTKPLLNPMQERALLHVDSWMRPPADEPTLIAPAAPDGPTITQPGDLPPGDLIPYEKIDRVPAGELQGLEVLAADALGVDRQVLVGRAGGIYPDGSAALFARSEYEGSEAITGYVVAAYRSGSTPDRRLFVAAYGTLEAAQAAYDRRTRLLGGQA